VKKKEIFKFLKDQIERREKRVSQFLGACHISFISFFSLFSLF